MAEMMCSKNCSEDDVAALKRKFDLENAAPSKKPHVDEAAEPVKKLPNDGEAEAAAQKQAEAAAKKQEVEAAEKARRAAATTETELPTVQGGFDAIDWAQQPAAFDADEPIDAAEAFPFFEQNGVSPGRRPPAVSSSA